MSALHFIHGGPIAISVFQMILNTVLSSPDMSEEKELNAAHASVLYKGHSKDKMLASSYRTISNCPFLAKALDYYVRSLSIEEWENARPENQFLGANKSHELGALLLTETINYSLEVLKKPAFCLLLDARSAFDLTIREITVRKLHLSGTSGHKLWYLDNRLKSRSTYVEWDHKILGPIHDELGFEQGGISSGDLYTLYNADQLTCGSEAKLGIDVGPIHVASLGQADDVVLISNDMIILNNHLQLTLDYCKDHHVTLAPEKIKLLVFHTSHQKHLVDYQKATFPININGLDIQFVDEAEHVGVIRSVHGNLPHIQSRISSHLKKLFMLLPAGLSRGRNLNPTASFRIESVYATPVLLSGLAAIKLSKSDLKILHRHLKEVIQNLQKLHKGTPECFINFLGGHPGATALVHMRQLSLSSE